MVEKILTLADISPGKKPERFMRRYAKRRGFKIDLNAKGNALEARVEFGRWLVDCPNCAGAERADPDYAFFYCLSCGNADNDGKVYPVKFPRHREAIERELLRRKAFRIGSFAHPTPGEPPRVWNGETVAQLAKDRREKRGLIHHSYTVVPTVASGELWTAANQNTYLRDNMAETIAARLVRKGGSATIWATPGTTTYTPGALMVMCGSSEWSGASASSGVVTITLPDTPDYSGVCVAIARYDGSGDDDIVVTREDAETDVNTIDLRWKDISGGNHTSIDFDWIWIGPIDS
jgi:hypothetical protein